MSEKLRTRIDDERNQEIKRNPELEKKRYMLNRSLSNFSSIVKCSKLNSHINENNWKDYINYEEISSLGNEICHIDIVSKIDKETKMLIFELNQDSELQGELSKYKRIYYYDMTENMLQKLGIPIDDNLRGATVQDMFQYVVDNIHNHSSIFD